MQASAGELRQALDVVGRIYDAALDFKRWPQVLSDVVRFVGGSKGLMFTPLSKPSDGGFAVPHGIPHTMLAQWEARYLQHDVWAQAGARLDVYRDGNVVLDAELVPEREFLDSVVYKELLAPVGVARLCCGIIFGRSAQGMLPTVCSVFRDAAESRFGDAERRKLQLVVPHLSRAFGVTYRLRDAEFRLATTLSALDQIRTGIALVNSAGEITHVNLAGRRSVDERDGLSLRGAILFADDKRAQRAIDQALRDCLANDVVEVPHFSCGVHVPRCSGAGHYVLQFAALSARNELSSSRSAARAIAFINDPKAPIPLNAGLLKRLFNLTAAEVSLAERLVAGDTALEAAVRRSISEATARTHLRRIFEKTNTRRQAELVKLLMSLH